MKRVKYRNMTIKIVAILFAIVLWTYVMSEINPRITKEVKNVKVDLLNLEAVERSGLMLMEPQEATVDVKIIGMRNDILNITAKDIIAQADLRGYSEGLHKVPIEIKSPYKVEIEDFNPKQVLFRFDKIIERQVPVAIKTVGNPADGYSIGNGKANPESIYIKGPRSWINSVASVIATVDVENVSAEVNTSIPIKVVDDSGKEVRGIEKEPNVININVPVLKVKNVPVEPEIEGEPLVGYQITKVSSNPQRVQIRGLEEIVDNITSIKTQPLDIGYTSRTIERETSFDLPQGIEIIDYNENPVITVEIEKVVQKVFGYTVNDLKFLNINENLEVDKSNINNKITISVEGIESIINKLNYTDIILSANLSDLTEGKHNVELMVVAPGGVKINEIEPKSIEVVLNKKLSNDENNEEDNVEERIGSNP